MSSTNAPNRRSRSDSSLKAEAMFRAKLEEFGATLLDTEWKGVSQPHLVRCSEGHEVTPRPSNVNHGGNPCRRCGWGGSSSNSSRSATAHTAFLARLEELGATLLEPWKGSKQPHLVRCSEGHDAHVRPNNATQGHHVCLACSWSVQDTLYVVYDVARNWVKFGITMGSHDKRLQAHARDGFSTVLAVRRGLPKGAAHRAEQDLIRRLRANGVQPVRGQEYFEGTYATFIMSELDQYLR